MPDPAAAVPALFATGWAVLPPAVAIVLAIVTRQVYLSLFAGIWAGWTILADGDPLAGFADALDACVNVFQDAGDTRVILFSAMIGALIALTQASGGVHGFVDTIKRRRLVRGQGGALLLSWSIGVVVFVESSITSLVNGAVSRPLFDELKISREKLAYLCDATAAPICVLLPLNAWGAYIAAILADQGFAEPVGLLVESIPYNLYAIGTLLFSLVVVVWWRKDFGPMKTAERRVRETGALLREGAEPVVSEELMAMEPEPGAPRRAINFLLPVLVMVAMMPIGLAVTGDGDLIAGSGSTSVLWAVTAAVLVAAVLAGAQRILTLKRTTSLFFTGVGGLVPLAVLMIFAFAIGDTAKAIGTGPFVAQLATDHLPVALVPALLFGLSCLVAFSTGTSWGTFAIMLQIGVPIAAALDVDPALAIGAVLSGGIFGDHCSPISDTTVVASMAAGTDHIDHVNTQLPYALTVAAAALAGFAILGATI